MGNLTLQESGEHTKALCLVIINKFIHYELMVHFILKFIKFILNACNSDCYQLVVQELHTRQSI